MGRRTRSLAEVFKHPLKKKKRDAYPTCAVIEILLLVKYII
jgi:hypothetical protein